MRLRDWTFYLAAFTGFFRGGELVEVLWHHLDFNWTRADGTEMRLGPSESLAGAKLTSCTIYLLESKTDVEALGQSVRLAATPGAHLSDCPVQLLRHLWRESQARGRIGAVFCDVREDARDPLAPLSDDTMRSRLKGYLKSFLGTEELPKYSLHSLRRGGATLAAQKGVPLRLIKHQGRWRSDTVWIYALVSDQEALQVSRTLLDELAMVKV